MDRMDLNFFVLLRNSSPELVIETCMNLGLIARKYVCPTCGKDMTLKPRVDSNDKFQWTCRTKSAPSHCVKRSIRSGSYFEKSNMSIPDILLITHLLLHQCEHKFAMFELKASSHTVCDWHNFIRETCVLYCLSMNDPIGGDGMVVEIHESNFGKCKVNRGKSVEDKWVFGGLERGTGRCFFKVVDRRDKETFIDVMKTYVLPGTTLYLDCWKSNNCLDDEGIQELAVNHSISFQQSAKEVLTGSIHFSDYIHLAYHFWRKAHANSGDMTRAFLAAVARVYSPRSQDTIKEEET